MCERCGHDRTLHEHYRQGLDCAARRCGCPGYLQPARAMGVWGRWLIAIRSAVTIPQ
jgi:hypothetical protein